MLLDQANGVLFSAIAAPFNIHSHKYANGNTVHLRPVRPELVEGPSYAARLRQAQPERIKLAK